MKVVGPVAAGLGISLEEAAAMTGTLGAWVFAVARPVRHSVARSPRLASPTTAAKRALKELG